MTTIRTIKSIASTLLLSGIVIFSSCKKDDEPKVDPREIFVGSYETVADCGDLGNADFEVDIKKDTDAKYIIIDSDLWDDLGVEFEDDLKAEVTGNTFKARNVEATVTDDNGQDIDVEVTIDGTINGKSLELEFEVEGPGGSVTCEIEGDKQ